MSACCGAVVKNECRDHFSYFNPSFKYRSSAVRDFLIFFIKFFLNIRRKKNEYKIAAANALK